MQGAQYSKQRDAGSKDQRNHYISVALVDEDGERSTDRKGESESESESESERATLANHAR